jgi:DNA-binding MarR family transcriptional regulator
MRWMATRHTAQLTPTIGGRSANGRRSGRCGCSFERARVVETHRRYLEATHGLLMTEFDMIAALGNTKGLRMGELADAMITSPGNITRVAQALEKRGVVERKRSPRSDRDVLARLTRAGGGIFPK